MERQTAAGRAAIQKGVKKEDGLFKQEAPCSKEAAGGR